jgi:hypothetical protein
MAAAGGAGNTPAAWHQPFEEVDAMAIVRSPSVPANPSRQRMPLQPVSVVAYFVGGASRQEVIDGSAVLSIATGDDTDRDETVYWCQALYQGDVCTGFRLTKFGTAEVYDVPRSLDSCDCPDHTYRPERPGGCKHQQALRQALPTVANDAPAVGAA